jgi:hypothetical protein
LGLSEVYFGIRIKLLLEVENSMLCSYIYIVQV